MINNNKLLAYLKLIGVIFLWGSVYHTAKYMVAYADIFSIAFVRFCLSSVVLLFAYTYRHGLVGFRKPKEHWLLLALMGIIGIGFYQLFFFGAELLIPANNIALIFAFAPCLTVILSIWVLKNKISKIGYLGIFIALVGAVGILTLGNNRCGHFFCSDMVVASTVGNLLALVATLVMAMYSVAVRKALQLGLDSLAITTFSSLFGAICLGVAFLFFGKPLHLVLHQSFSFWVAMLYTAVIATVVAYKWYSDSFSHIEVGKVAVFLNGVPFATILVGIIVFGDGVSLTQAICGLVIVSGVLLTNYANKPSPQIQKENTQ